MKEPFVLIELFLYIHVFINIFIHLHTHFTHLKKSPPFSKSPVNIFIFNPGTSSSYLGNWWDESERSMWDIHPMIPDMMILWWQQIYRWTLSEGSINHIFSPVHQSISHQWIIDESIWLHSGFDAVSCRCGHVFEEKKEGIQHVHTYPWCQTTPSNTPFVWSQGPNPPLSQVPSQTFPWFLHVSSLHVQGCKVDKTKKSGIIICLPKFYLWPKHVFPPFQGQLLKILRVFPMIFIAGTPNRFAAKLLLSLFPKRLLTVEVCSRCHFHLEQ